MAVLRFPLASLVCLASFGAAVAGCDDGAPKPIELAAYRAELEAAACELAVRCELSPDASTCRATRFADRATLQLLADVGFGVVSYDAAAGRACVEAVRAAPCLDTAQATSDLAAACAGVFQGTLSSGEGCFVGAECTSGYCDRADCKPDTCCAGACAPNPGRAAEGEPCDMLACADDLVCLPDATTNLLTCVATLGNGAPCSLDLACGDEQACDPGQGTCYQLSPAGGACNPALAGRTCLASDEACGDDGRCGPKPDVGEACGKQGACKGYAVCAEGTCAARPVVGEDCSALPCLGELACVDGLCQAPGATPICAIAIEAE